VKAAPLVHATDCVDQSLDKSLQTTRTSARRGLGSIEETPSKSPHCTRNHRFLCKQEVAGSIPAGSIRNILQMCIFSIFSIFSCRSIWLHDQGIK
jgi:hypothetical protein